MPLKIAYVLTTNGKDIYSRMTLISAVSVRITNPEAIIFLVCDSISFVALQKESNPILEVCDEVKKVETAQGVDTFRNRWIKTQLDQFVAGPCMYLDADTLVRGSLSNLPTLAPELGVVANHNKPDLADQIWVEDTDFLDQMGWPRRFEFYANGGLQFYQPCSGVERFYESWHRLWLDGVKATGRLRDQPSLNTAIRESGVLAARLPEKYNLQLQASHRGCPGALVWHFWAAAELQDTTFRRLLRLVPHMSLKKIERHVQQAIQSPYPYPNQDFFGQRIGRKVEKGETISTFERAWLTDRKGAVRFWLGGVRAGILKTLRGQG